MSSTCDWGGCHDEPATHLVTLMRPDGTMIERRPMCRRHAGYAVTFAFRTKHYRITTEQLLVCNGVSINHLYAR